MQPRNRTRGAGHPRPFPTYGLYECLRQTASKSLLDRQGYDNSIDQDGLIAPQKSAVARTIHWLRSQVFNDGHVDDLRKPSASRMAEPAAGDLLIELVE